jgi:hypothetical protein
MDRSIGAEGLWSWRFGNREYFPHAVGMIASHSSRLSILVFTWWSWEPSCDLGNRFVVYSGMKTFVISSGHYLEETDKWVTTAHPLLLAKYEFYHSVFTPI